MKVTVSKGVSAIIVGKHSVSLHTIYNSLVLPVLMFHLMVM